MKIAEELLKKHYVCDWCLGRAFAQLLSGYTNKERGKVVRTSLAMVIDSGESMQIEPSNFHGYNFRNNKDFAKKIKKPKKCYVCRNIFDDLDKIADKVVKEVKGLEFKDFVVGSRISKELLEVEEDVWERVGIDYCEQLRAELNRELGKILEKKLKKPANLKDPEMTILINLEKNLIELTVRPLFIFGFYNKLKRGFPQSKWGTPGVYKTSVEEIIAKPAMKLSKGKDHKFHGAGREDIDARCFGWRPFVVEIDEPQLRKIDLKKVLKQINKTKKVKVKELSLVDMKTVRKIKKARPDKTYRALIKLNKPIKRKDLNQLKKLVGSIKQQTPKRVLHRRADLERSRKVKSIKTKFKNKKTFELIVKGTSGLYIKELISGDFGRTKPSVSELLDRKATCKELDIIEIQKLK
jgi:tRNA pseudouridine synthase 10